MTKRNIQPTLIALSLTACLVSPLSACTVSSAEQPETPPSHIETNEVTVGSWTSPEAGFFTKTYWLDTGRDTVVFDAQFTPDLAKQALAAIREQTQSPIRYLVVTHPNPDKFNGAAVFKAAGAKVVASRATADAMAGVHAYKKAYFVGNGTFSEEAYPSLPKVDIRFDASHRLELDGDVAVELSVLKHSGVAATQTVAWVPESKALFVGDLVHPRIHAWVEGSIIDGAPKLDIPAWTGALGELQRFDGGTIYPGRGEPISVTTGVKEQQAYLSKVSTIAERWGDDVRAGRVQADDIGSLVQRIHEAFPEYGMGFMTTYSAYGLAASVLK